MYSSLPKTHRQTVSHYISLHPSQNTSWCQHIPNRLLPGHLRHHSHHRRYWDHHHLHLGAEVQHCCHRNQSHRKHIRLVPHNREDSLPKYPNHLHLHLDTKGRHRSDPKSHPLHQQSHHSHCLNCHIPRLRLDWSLHLRHHNLDPPQSNRREGCTSKYPNPQHRNCHHLNRHTRVDPPTKNRLRHQ